LGNCIELLKTILRKSFCCISLIYLVIGLTSTPLYADNKKLLKSASVMINQGEFGKAFHLLEKKEVDYAGWWQYDYLLGVAALESGKPNLAVFALQRAIAMNPNLVGARVDLGRAYYAVNEYQPAKLEFLKVLEKNPKNPVKRVAQTYLSSIKRKENPSRFGVKYFVGMSGGYDSNANSATDKESFNGFDLNEKNRKSASSYYSLLAGMSLAYQRNKKQLYRLSTAVSKRSNQSASQVDYLNYSLNAQWILISRQLNHNFGIRYSRADIDDAISSKTTGLNYSGRRNWFDKIYGTLFLSTNYVSFNEALSYRNAYQLFSGIGVDYKPGYKFINNIAITTMFGVNTPKDSTSLDKKTLISGRLTTMFGKIKSLPGNIMISTGLLNSSYKNTNRDERLLDFSFMHSTKFRKSWELALRLEYLKNSSTVELYDYSKFNSSLTIRKFI